VASVSEVERNFAALFPREAIKKIDEKSLIEMRMAQAV
jgi:hypothetical protein